MTGAQGFIVWDDIWLILINFKQLKQSSIYSNHGGSQAGPAGVAFAGGAKTGPKSNMQVIIILQQGMRENRRNAIPILLYSFLKLDPKT